MAKTEQVNVRIEPEIKAAAEAVFEQLGMTPSQAITMFYRQVSFHQGLGRRGRDSRAEGSLVSEVVCSSGAAS